MSVCNARGEKIKNAEKVNFMLGIFYPSKNKNNNNNNNNNNNTIYVPQIHLTIYILLHFDRCNQ